MLSRRLISGFIVAFLLVSPSITQPHVATAATTLTFAVTTTADAPDVAPGDGLCATATGQCSLRAAVQEANAQAAGSAISITIPAGTYLLPLGALVLATNTIALTGAGARQTVVVGQGQRVLAVGAAAVVTVNAVTLAGGNAGTSAGGALANQGTVILNSSALINNTAANGGAIANGAGGRLWLLDSVVTSDTAPNGWGGGVLNQGALTVSASVLSGNTALIGGGIANVGRLTVVSSTVATNIATTPDTPDNYGGGGLYTNGATTVVSSTFSENTTGHFGAGIDNDTLGTLIVSASTFRGNTAVSFGGGIRNDGTATIVDSTVSGNSGRMGGGIESGGMMAMSYSTVSGNTATEGGGGLSNGEMTLAVSNSTIWGNMAPGGGGAIWNSGTVRLAYATLAANSSGVYQNTLYGPVTMVLAGTIVASSTSGPNCTGTISEALGYNLDSGTSCGLSQPTDLSNTNPQIGPLANNGGPTQTMALFPGSPAIDRGGTSTNGCPATDQRGVARPQGLACDIGAYEVIP